MEVSCMRRILLMVLAGLVLVSTAVGCKTTDTGSENTTPSGGSGNTKTEWPKYEITGQTVKYLCWSNKKDLEDSTTYLYRSNALLKEHYNCEISIVRTTYEELPTKAASLVLSGESPDLIFYKDQDNPGFIKNNIVQETSKYIDYSLPLWKDMKSVNERLSYQGKQYFIAFNEFNDSYVYYWKNIFTDAGLETPLELYKKNEWTLSKFQELAKAVTADTDRNGVVDLYGFSVHPYEVFQCNNVDFVTVDANGKYTNNLRDPGHNAFFDFMYNTGSIGDNSRLMAYNNTSDFTAKKTAMYWGNAWVLSTLYDQFKAGEMEFAPSPKVDAKDQYYVKGRVDGAWIANGASNPGGAAAYLAVCRFMAFDEEYKAAQRVVDQEKSGFNEETYALFDEMNSDKFTKVYYKQPGVGNWGNDAMWNLWSDVGLWNVPWASTVEKFYPVLQEEIDQANK